MLYLEGSTVESRFEGGSVHDSMGEDREFGCGVVGGLRG